MRAAVNLWIAWQRVRRKVGRQSDRDWSEVRARFIRDHAPGRTFADVGGLYGTDPPVAVEAVRAGATAVTLFDGGEPTPEFLRYPESASIRFVQGDLDDAASAREIGPHDVVWCSGVLYHTPHPLQQLMHLRQITREVLFLGTHTIPEVPGVPQASIFYPYLDEGHRRALAAPYGDPASLYGVGTAFDDRPMYGHANFWFGISPSALRAMLTAARFEVLEERHPTPYPWEVDVVARPVAKHPSLPPAGYYRERGQRRERGEPQLRFDGYYDDPGPADGSADEIYPRLDTVEADRPGLLTRRRWRHRQGR